METEDDGGGVAAYGICEVALGEETVDSDGGVEEAEDVAMWDWC